MALDVSKPGGTRPAINSVVAPNGRTWVWDRQKWVLSHEAYLNFEAESPIRVGSYETVNSGVTSRGIKHYLDANDLDDLPNVDDVPSSGNP